MANNPLNTLRTVRSTTSARPRTRKEAVRLGADLASAAISKTNPVVGLAARVVMGRPKLVLGLMLSSAALVVFALLFAITTLIALVSATAVQPIQAVASVVGWVPGLGPDDQPEEAPAEQLCVPQPADLPAVSATTAPPNANPPSAEPDTAPDTETPAPTPSPATGQARAALSDNGRVTDWAMGLARQAPDGSEARQVQAWLLFTMARPDDPRAASWQAFTEPYGQAVRIVSVQATGSDIASTIDASADYHPYALAAASLTLAGIMDHRFEDPTGLEETLADTVLSACTTKVQDGIPTKTPDPSNPVLPARHPGWSAPPSSESSVTAVPSGGQPVQPLPTVGP